MIGRTLGRYQIESKLGEGGMAVVYRARDTLLERTVAIRVLAAEASDHNARRRLLEEARAASAINHPNICTIHEVGEAEGFAYIVMEYVEGGSLRDLAAEGGLPLDTVGRYGRSPMLWRMLTSAGLSTAT